MLRISCGIVVSILALAAAARAEDTPDTPPVNFNRDIRPILSNYCFNCHGFDAANRQADLRLDLREQATVAGASGAIAVVPGKADESELIRRILSDDDAERMPPADSNKQLNDAQKALLVRWINEGADYSSHWGFVAPKRPEPPQANPVPGRVLRNPIDVFVAKRLEREGLTMSPEADKTTLIRRVTLDLTGLPPTPAEVDAFLADTSPDAYEKLVDRLLASPRYGENMARYWLDAARYADTNGFQMDMERSMWPWRDWVIRAYNQNMPFDQFTIEQLAGDLLPDPTPDQLLATGFNRNHPFTIEGGVIDEEYRVEYVMDRVHTTATTWMGLTMSCARCHDHKYDPISQQEFYQFFAFFNQTPEKGIGSYKPTGPANNAPMIRAATPEQSRALAEVEHQMAEVEARQAALVAAADAGREAWEKSLLARLGSDGSSGWSVLVPLSYVSQGKATLTKLADESLLASGANPRNDIYDVQVEVPPGTLALRLEALTDDSLPGTGPGRFENSNFVLTEFEVRPVAADGSLGDLLRLASATADYSQSGFSIQNTIDGNAATGWAVDGPSRKLPVTAVFGLANPVPAGTTRLHVRLRHESHYASHSIGRMRLSATTQVAQLRVPQDTFALLQVAAAERTPLQQARLREIYLDLSDPQWAANKTRLAELQQERTRLQEAMPEVMVMQELRQPRKTFVLDRGQYDQPKAEVEAAVPAVLPPLPEGATANRLALARWLVDPAHPLTARVIVNRDWQRYFGVGIVKTAEDFGIQSEWPSHPELLDWLATEFISSGWDVKNLQKLIVTSATYRQASTATAEALEHDPENRLLARGPRGRLPAEAVRDCALAISGLLSDKMGGPSVYPYQPDGLWLDLNDRKGFLMTYQTSKGEDLYRRSLYTFWKRTSPPPAMQAFDAPEREFCVVRRSVTNTPLQALVLLNDPQFVEAARKFAERMLREGGDTVEGRLTYGFRLAVARRPRDAELQVLKRALEEQRGVMTQDPEAARRMLAVGEAPVDADLEAAELAAWANVARLILNLDETIVRN